MLGENCAATAPWLGEYVPACRDNRRLQSAALEFNDGYLRCGEAYEVRRDEPVGRLAYRTGAVAGFSGLFCPDILQPGVRSARIGDEVRSAQHVLLGKKGNNSGHALPKASSR